MKKIALIEDKYVRQKYFLETNSFSLDTYDSIIENFILEKANTLLREIISDTFDLDEYDIIILHKSVQTKDDTNTTIIDRLTEFCKEKNKTLILFSGGIAANYYKENYLELNSQTFYSQNLKVFLEATMHDNENILMLCYGLKWKLNILLNTLEKVNYYIEKTDKESFKYIRFAKDCKIELLDSLGIEFEKPKIEAQNISLQEIRNYKDTIYLSIQKRLMYE